VPRLSRPQVAATRESAEANELDQSLQVCKIPTTLRKHVLQFNDFAASSAQNVIEQMEMPGTLRLQLDMVNNRNLFLKVPFFKNCDLTQIMMLVQLIKKEYVWPGKVVVHENSHVRAVADSWFKPASNAYTHALLRARGARPEASACARALCRLAGLFADRRRVGCTW
jgi:hypothetical protein